MFANHDNRRHAYSLVSRPNLLVASYAVRADKPVV